MIDKISKSIKYVTSGALVLKLFTLGVSAQGVDVPLPESVVDGDLLSWVQDVLNLVIGLAGLIAVAILVYSGILYIISSGDEGKIETATKGITYSIIGLVICFISVIIVNFVLTQVLGVDAGS